ncbi:fasciclin domain-containing protein [Pedobacter nyackensis]|nr:fasciclin domain-containing protein [Pedobacter nyackensis]
MNIKLIAICLLFITLASCRKTEFQPEVEGVQVPHVDLSITLNQVLEASANTLFKAAWKRSNMNSIVEKRGNQTPMTLLVPSDAAFIADGITLDVINNTTPELLDSLLLYHTLSQGVNPKDLSERGENTIGLTLLENTYLQVKGYENQYQTDPYFYRQYLNVSGNELLINGKKSGTAIVTLAKNGTFWPIDHVLKKPTKTMMQVLQEDGRFGMYLEIMTKTDQQWEEAVMGAAERVPFSKGLAAGYDILIFKSIFAPTDEAFHQAGFKDVDDLIALNNRNILPYFDWNTYELVGSGYATDTLLTMHRWGKLFKEKDGWGYGDDNPDIFYSNDLNNNLLSGYALSTSGYTGTVPIFYVPLDFGKNAAGKVTVKTKSSEYPAATIVESDINTLMGPIHVVNRLMPPKNFKF